MNKLRVFTILVALVASIMAISTIQGTLGPALPQDDVAMVWLSFILLWFSAEMGLFGIQQMMSEARSKKIQKELDMERSFREMGGKR